MSMPFHLPWPAIRMGLILLWLALMALITAHIGSLFVAKAFGGKLAVLSPLPARGLQKPVSAETSAHLILKSRAFPHNPLLSQEAFSTDDPSPISTPISLDVELIGTVAGGRSLGYAILKEPNTPHQTLYRLNDEIPNVGKLIGISRKAIRVALPTGREFTLEASWAKTPMSPPPQKVSYTPSSHRRAQRTVLDRREILEAFSNMPLLLSQVRATPSFSQSGMNGVALQQIKSPSLFERLGFLAGDIVRTINGMPIQQPSALLTALQQLPNESQISVEIERQGKNLTLHYDIR